MANITVDIQAKVVGYEQSIKALQAALAKVDPGSEMGKSIAKAMEYNLACEYVNAAEKEAFKLKTCLDNELTIELQEVQREIAEHGTDWVTARHPETKTVIDNMNSIFEEITEWRKQIKQLLLTMC